MGPVLSGHQGPTEEELGEALPQGKDAGVLPAETVRRCGLGDGAAWIWTHVQAWCPQACQGLDDYHCAE